MTPQVADLASVDGPAQILAAIARDGGGGAAVARVLGPWRVEASARAVARSDGPPFVSPTWVGRSPEFRRTSSTAWTRSTSPSPRSCDHGCS